MTALRHLIDIILCAAGIGATLVALEWELLVAVLGLVILTGVAEGVSAAWRGRLRLVMGWLPALAGVVGTWFAFILFEPTPVEAAHSDSGLGVGIAVMGALVLIPLFAISATSIAVLTRAIASRGRQEIEPEA